MRNPRIHLALPGGPCGLPGRRPGCASGADVASHGAPAAFRAGDRRQPQKPASRVLADRRGRFGFNEQRHRHLERCGCFGLPRRVPPLPLGRPGHGRGNTPAGWGLEPGTECVNNSFSRLDVANCGGRPVWINNASCMNNRVTYLQFANHPIKSREPARTLTAAMAPARNSAAPAAASDAHLLPAKASAEPSALPGAPVLAE